MGIEPLRRHEVCASDKTLAIAGGEPARPAEFIFKGWPVSGDRERELVEEVMAANHFGVYSGEYSDQEACPGDKISAFVKGFSAYLGVKHGLAVTNGTAALNIACRAISPDPGDEIITPASSFSASCLCAFSGNAIPVFVDVDPETLCISPDRIEEAITDRTRAIVAVHLDGYMCDMDRIMEIAEKRGLYVIEDCARAHCSAWRGKRAGSIGHFGCFSFQSSKLMTCGEGGYVCTDDDELYSRAWSIHNCGRQIGGGFYEHYVWGGNERMSQFQAAVLVAQLERLPEQAERRRRNMEYVERAIKDIPGVRHVKRDPRATELSYWFGVFHYDESEFNGMSIDLFCEAMTAEGFAMKPSARGGLNRNPLFTAEGLRKNKLDFLYRDHGRVIDYPSLSFPAVEATRAFRVYHSFFLGSIDEMKLFVEAIRKVRANADEALAVERERDEQ